MHGHFQLPTQSRGNIRTEFGHKPARNQRIIALYKEGKTFPEIKAAIYEFDGSRLKDSGIRKVMQRYAPEVPRRRDRLPSLERRDSLLSQVKALAKDGKDAREIAESIPARLRTVQTHLSTLRRKGEIGVFDGKARLRTRSDENPPKPHMTLDLDFDLRGLIDGEAEDRNTTTHALVIEILTRVMNDQELIEAVLGEE